jgi:PAS domain S-box-containing protein
MPERIASEDFVRLAVEACPSGMIMTDAEGKIVLINAEVERLFGYHRDELVDQSIDILVPASARPHHGGLRASFVAEPKARRMGVGRDLFGVRKDGTQIPVEIGLNPIQTKVGLMILRAITDITERKLSDERFRLVVEACPNGMIMTDADGKIVLINTEAERLFGYGRQELSGRSIDILVPAMPRPGHAKLRKDFVAAPKARRMGIGRDLYGVRKDGTQIPIEIGLNPIQTNEGLMILSAITDISERKRATQELANRSEQLERSNADLEQFAHVASHDLQEPLRMVSTYTSLIAEYYNGRSDEKVEKYILYVLDGAKRMQRLIQDLLSYSRVDSEAELPMLVKSDVALKIALANLDASIEKSHAKIDCDELPAVFADATQLAQIFQNLIGNALKFSGECSPHVRVGAKREGDKWVFHVNDNGIGIEKKYAERVFLMSERLNERSLYEGSGIGLAIVKKIITRHGGLVWFDSELKVGTTFYFTIPATQGSPHDRHNQCTTR